MERAEHSTISLGDEIKIRKYDELNSCYHKNQPLEFNDIDAKHLQELFNLNRERIKEYKKLKKHYIESEQERIKQQELYSKAIDKAIGLRQKLDLIPINKALDLIKQKRENARVVLERNYKCLDELNHKVCSTAVEMVECEEEKRRISEIYNLRLREEIATYTDCIATIEAEMGRL